MLESQLGFLEHHETRLIHHESSRHVGVNPNPAALVGLAVSARKSHLVQLTDEIMAGAAPELGKDDALRAITTRDCYVQEATLKGLREALYNYNRACLVGDEPITMYKTRWADADAKVHYLYKPNLNNYLLSEPDDIITGGGKVHLGAGKRHYLAMHKS